MNELALFAGAGGGILGAKLLGWRTVCAVEIDEYARSVLMARQDDGCLEPFPIWDDIKTFDAQPWRGLVDVVSGGFPCQDISTAGKGSGIEGGRSGLWSHMARVISEVRPRYVLVENSPLLVSRGLDVVLADLAAMGFDAEWGAIGADAVGLPHHRTRIWVVAYPKGEHCNSWHLLETRNRESPKGQPRRLPSVSICQEQWEANQGIVSTPVFCRNDDGVACRSQRLRTIGNGQIPAVVRLAWHVLSDRFPQGA